MIIHIIIALFVQHLIHTSSNAQTEHLQNEIISIGSQVLKSTQSTVIKIYSHSPIRVTRIVTSFLNYYSEKHVNHVRFDSKPHGNIYETIVTYACPFQFNYNIYDYVIVNLTITVCTANSISCNTGPQTHLSHIFMIDKRLHLFLMQTDRPYYEPGDTVQFYAQILQSNQSILHYEQLSDLSNYSYEFSRMLNLDPYYGNDTVSLVIHQPYGESIDYGQINQLDLDNQIMSVNLSKTTAPGLWTIGLDMRNEESELNFVVLPKLYSKPIVHFDSTIFTQNDQPFMSLKVCAQDTNGQVSQGRINILICLCHKPEVGDFLVSTPTELEQLMSRKTCVQMMNQPYIHPRPCVHLIDKLNTDGCGRYNFSLKGLGDVYSSNQVLLTCVDLYDQSEGQSFVVCDRPYRTLDYSEVKLYMSSYYKRGLPISGKLKLNGPFVINVADQLCEVGIEQDIVKCNSLSVQKSQNTNPHYELIYVRTNANGWADFQFHPVDFDDPIRLRAKCYFKSEHRSFNWLSSNHIFGSYQSGFRSQSAYATLSGWASQTGEMILTWPNVDSVQLNCDHSLNLTIISNRNLGDKQFHIAYYQDGTLVDSIIPDDPILKKLDNECTNQDNVLGHYECISPGSDDVQCLPGWSGLGCLRPICAEPCDAHGGSCSVPNTCDCKPGWYGSWCEFCRQCFETKSTYAYQSSSCTSSSCLCDWMVENQRCNDIPVIWPTLYAQPQSDNPFPKLIAPNQTYPKFISKPTIFRRHLHIRRFPNPDINTKIIIYYIKSDNSTNNLEFITTNALEVHSQPNCQSNQTEQVIDIFKNNRDKIILPGSEISLELNISKQNLPNPKQCYLRVFDSRLKQFENGQFIVDSKWLVKHKLPISQRKYLHEDQDNCVEEIWPTHLEISGIGPNAQRKWNNLTCEHEIVNGFKYEANMRIEGNYFYLPRTSTADSSWSQIMNISTLVFDRISFEQTDDNNYLHYKRQIRLPDDLISMNSVQANLHCISEQTGLWTYVSEPLQIHPKFNLNINGPDQIKLNEIFDLNIEVRSNMENMSECYPIHLNLRVHPDVWEIQSVRAFYDCVCENRVYNYVWTLSAHQNLRDKSTIFMDFFILSNSDWCNLDVENVGQTMSFRKTDQTNQMFQMRLYRSITYHVEIDDHYVSESSETVLICFQPNQLSEQVISYPIVIPRIADDYQRISLRGHLFYTSNLIGPIMNYMERIFFTVKYQTIIDSINAVGTCSDLINYVITVADVDRKHRPTLLYHIGHVMYEHANRFQTHWCVHQPREHFIFDSSMKCDRILEVNGSNENNMDELIFNAKIYHSLVPIIDTTNQFSWLPTSLHSSIIYLSGRLSDYFQHKYSQITCTNLLQLNQTRSLFENSIHTMLDQVMEFLINLGEYQHESLLYFKENRTQKIYNHLYPCVMNLILENNDNLNWTFIDQLPTYLLVKLIYSLQLFTTYHTPNYTNHAYYTNNGYFIDSLIRRQLNRRRVEQPQSHDKQYEQFYWESGLKLDNRKDPLSDQEFDLNIQTTSLAYLVYQADQPENVNRVLPIIRWLLNSQTWWGDYETSRATYYAIHALCKFATSLISTPYDRSETNTYIRVDVPQKGFQYETYLDPIDFFIGNTDLINYYDPYIEFMNINLKNPKSRGCIHIKLGYTYLKLNLIQTQLDSKYFQINIEKLQKHSDRQSQKPEPDEKDGVNLKFSLNQLEKLHSQGKEDNTTVFKDVLVEIETPSNWEIANTDEEEADGGLIRTLKDKDVVNGNHSITPVFGVLADEKIGLGRTENATGDTLPDLITSADDIRISSKHQISILLRNVSTTSDSENASTRSFNLYLKLSSFIQNPQALIVSVKDVNNPNLVETLTYMIESESEKNANNVFDDSVNQTSYSNNVVRPVRNIRTNEISRIRVNQYFVCPEIWNVDESKMDRIKDLLNMMCFASDVFVFHSQTLMFRNQIQGLVYQISSDLRIQTWAVVHQLQPSYCDVYEENKIYVILTKMSQYTLFLGNRIINPQYVDDYALAEDEDTEEALNKLQTEDTPVYFLEVDRSPNKMLRVLLGQERWCPIITTMSRLLFSVIM